ncbi:phosphatidylinositol 5-phosphate 4-kinase type-2 alpha-like, partial [Haliotis rubra]|uniref:phosphatidylinositol 5-phosphate 4-kinase type-2 alpha-like n=1 Tax=Haliotis rubra TaxID=36100 RepID=UPI001EE62A35
SSVETYMVVMRNIFSPRLGIHKKYDLKGSTVDRQASDKERVCHLEKSIPGLHLGKKSLPTLKDVDFVNDGVTIQVGQEFLASLHLMDYSLIVGIHDPEKGDSDQTDLPAPDDGEEGADEEEENGLEEEMTDGYGAVPTPPDSPQPATPTPFTGELDSKLEQYAIKSSENQEIYFMALIDVLTKYGMKKRTAQAAKTVKHGAGAEISTVRPDQYAKRFLEFISKSIE